VTDAVFNASFADFTPNAGVYADFDYYGDWWSTNVGTTTVGGVQLNPRMTPG
jgi:hypothetical protein